MNRNVLVAIGIFICLSLLITMIVLRHQILDHAIAPFYILYTIGFAIGVLFIILFFEVLKKY